MSLLGEIDGIRGEFKSGNRMTPNAIKSLRQSVLVTSTGASTRIEGSKITDKEVDKIMHGLSISKFAERDYQEVQGYLEVLQNVFDSFETLSLRESTIMALHSQKLKYYKKDTLHRKKKKKKENIVGILGPDGKVQHVIFETTLAFLTPKEMQEIVEWTTDALERKRFHPLLVIANFIVEFLKIHPFEDGNGRLSRILTNLLLLRSGYQFVQYVSHEQIIERRKDEYYLSLRKSQQTLRTDDATIVPWLNFFLSVIHEQASKALVYLSEEKVEDLFSPKETIIWEHLCAVDMAAPSTVVKATGISLATVRQSLNSLVKRGKIKRVGNGRSTRYVKL